MIEFKGVEIEIPAGMVAEVEGNRVTVRAKEAHPFEGPWAKRSLSGGDSPDTATHAWPDFGLARLPVGYVKVAGDRVISEIPWDQYARQSVSERRFFTGEDITDQH